MNKIKMVQRNDITWCIMTQKGIVLQDDIRARNILEAEDYVRNYITSFVGWSYELEELLDDDLG